MKADAYAKASASKGGECEGIKNKAEVEAKAKEKRIQTIRHSLYCGSPDTLPLAIDRNKSWIRDGYRVLLSTITLHVSITLWEKSDFLTVLQAWADYSEKYNTKYHYLPFIFQGHGLGAYD